MLTPCNDRSTETKREVFIERYRTCNTQRSSVQLIAPTVCPLSLGLAPSIALLMTLEKVVKVQDWKVTGV